MEKIPVKRLLLIALLIPALFAQAVPAQQSADRPPAAFADRVQQIMDRPEFRHAIFGMQFTALDTGQPVYRLNAEKLFTAASTTKLVTEGTALELLGGDHRFHTRIYRTGPVLADGTLDGDLVLVASGDPNLSGRIRDDGTLAFENEDHSYDGDPVPGDPLLVVRELAKQVAARNIKKIRGRVLVDASLFPEGDRELGTGVVISPVVVNDNLVDLLIAPAPTVGAPAALTQSPVTSYVKFVSEITTGKAGSKVDITPSSDVANADGSRTVTLKGSVPAGKPTTTAYPVPEPSRFAEVVLTEALAENGISVAPGSPATPRDFKALSASYTPDRVVAEHVSPPLTEEIKVTLKVSQNLHASMTPLLIAALLAKDPKQTGFDLEREFLVRAGLDVSGAVQGDGAGGDAHFTPEFMVAYLSYMAKQKSFASFFNALPVLGRDGTLFDIQPASPAAGHVQAKTGTFMNDDPLNRGLLVTAKGLAGYMTTASGRRLVFAIYVNNVPVAEQADVKKIAGQALGEIAAAAYESIP